METTYVGSDPTILKARIAPTINSTTPYLDNLADVVRQPLPVMAGSNFPLSSLFEAAASSRMKGEDNLGSIFARAATHLYMQTQHIAKQYAEMSQTASPSTCDFRANLQQVVATTPCATTSDTMSMIADPTSNSSMYLISASSYMMNPSKVNPQSILLREHDNLQLLRVNSENDAYRVIAPTSFSEIMIHAMEFSEASRNRVILDTRSASETTSHDPKPSLTKGISHSNNLNQKWLAVSAQSDALYCPSSPSRQDSSVMSAEDSDGDQKPSNNNSIKRRNCGHRNSQQKKVAYVPFCENKQRGEAPPSDTWAWRKYGQKPIKGSPFPRGYYRCSSSKGCPARKQVERSRYDPSMVMVTYTAEHNHPWPLNKQANSSKDGNQAEQSQGAMEDSSRHHHNAAENLFSSIINSSNGVQEQVFSSMGPLEGGESSLLQRDVDLCLSQTNTDWGDVFDNLAELPELSAIFFSKGSVDEYFDEERFKHSELL